MDEHGSPPKHDRFFEVFRKLNFDKKKMAIVGVEFQGCIYVLYIYIYMCVINIYIYAFILGGNEVCHMWMDVVYLSG